jgi:hypothetical protein
MRRILRSLAAGIATLFFFAAGGLAATVLTSDEGSGTGVAVGACDEDGVGVSYDVVYSPTRAAFVVTQVRLADLAAQCAGGTVSVVLRDEDGGALASASRAVSRGEMSVALAGRPRAADVTDVAVAFAAPAETSAPTADREETTPPETITTPSLPPGGDSQLCNRVNVIPASLCLFGGKRASRLVGGAGRDLLVAGSAGDVLLGRGGADILLGGPGADRIGGGSGDDVIEGRGGPDRIYGGPGKDVIDGGAGFDVCHGGPGRDRFHRCEVVRQ